MRVFRKGSGEKERREEGIVTKKGIILYKGRSDTWSIRYPDGAWRSDTTTDKVILLVYHLGRGKSMKVARKLTFPFHEGEY